MYNLKELSLNPLKKILLVMNYFKNRLEIENLETLDMGLEGELVIGSLKEKEINHIIANLLENKAFSSFFIIPQSGRAFISINKEDFEIFYSELLNRIETFNTKNVVINKLEFDEASSVLIINNYKIQIAKQKDKETYPHEILKVLFKDSRAKIFYSELAESILGIDHIDYKTKDSWRKFYRACQYLKDKILKGTNYSIKDFIIFDTKSLKINEKYLVP